MQDHFTTPRFTCQYCGKPFDSIHVGRNPRYCSITCCNKDRSEPTETRFWRYVEKATSCWLWVGGKDRHGHGAFSISHRVTTPAHRFSWELHQGPIPDGMLVIHKCASPACVNPDHLFLGTAVDKVQESIRKGTAAVGERHWTKRRPPRIFTCAQCGKEYASPKSRSDRTYCSRDCYEITRKASKAQKAARKRPIGRPPEPLTVRFWRYVQKTNGCWLWTGTKNSQGYGKIIEGGTKSRTLAAHRVSWTLHNGPIPNGLWTLHKCDVPACVNPAHLYLGTHADNTRDMIERKRYVCRKSKNKRT